MEWYLTVLRKYAVFEGRARRKELWMFVLINIIISLVLGIVDGAAGLTTDNGSIGLLSGLYGLAVLIPSLAVGARRLHDTGRSAWWLFIALIPVIGAIVLIVFYAIEGESGDNAYGPDPKATPAPGVA